MLTRRHFLKTVAATAAGSAATRVEVGAEPRSAMLKPARLKAGSVVGIVSPAGATFVREELDV